jgi:hypothetical protein
MDWLHRVLTGQPLSSGELRIAGLMLLLWMLMDLSQWTTDWLWPRLEWTWGVLR